MEPTKFTKLLNDYILGTISQDDKEVLEKVLRDSEGLRDEYKDHQFLVEALKQQDDILNLQQILEKQHGKQEGPTETTRRSLFRRRRVSKKQKFASTLGIGLAVSIIMGLTISYILLNNKHKLKLKENQAISETNDRIDLLKRQVHELQNELNLITSIPPDLILSFGPDNQQYISLSHTISIGDVIAIRNGEGEREIDIKEIFRENEISYLNTNADSQRDSLVTKTSLQLGDSVVIQTLQKDQLIRYESLVHVRQEVV